MCIVHILHDSRAFIIVRADVFVPPKNMCNLQNNKVVMTLRLAVAEHVVRIVTGD